MSCLFRDSPRAPRACAHTHHQGRKEKLIITHGGSARITLRMNAPIAAALLLLLQLQRSCAAAPKPHIVYMLADNIGYGGLG